MRDALDLVSTIVTGQQEAVGVDPEVGGESPLPGERIRELEEGTPAVAELTGARRPG
jgi:hypothetical protein